jgi:hypothetical protein
MALTTDIIAFILADGTFKDYNFGAPKYFNGQSATIFVSSHKFIGQEDLHCTEILCQLF